MFCIDHLIKYYGLIFLISFYFIIFVFFLCNFMAVFGVVCVFGDNMEKKISCFILFYLGFYFCFGEGFAGKMQIMFCLLKCFFVFFATVCFLFWLWFYPCAKRKAFISVILTLWSFFFCLFPFFFFMFFWICLLLLLWWILTYNFSNCSFGFFVFFKQKKKSHGCQKMKGCMFFVVFWILFFYCLSC